MARQIVVEIIGDHSNFSGSLRGAGQDAGRFGNVVTGIGQGIGQGVARGMGMAVTAVGDFVTGSINAASSLEQSQGAVQSVFGESASIITDFGRTAAENYGLSMTQVNESGAVLGAMLQGLGFSADESAGHVITLTERAADMAATFGGTTADALSAIGSLMRGERDPIEQFGVSIRQADVDAALLAQGLDHLTGAARTEAEAMAVMDLMMQDTASSSGAFARESDTMAGSQARAQAKFENVSAALGTKLLPIMVGAFGFINDVALPALIGLIDFLSKVWTAIQPVATTIVRTLVPAFKGIVDIVKTVLGRLGDVIDFVRGMPGKISRAASGMWDGIAGAFRGAINSVIRVWNNLGFNVPSVNLGPLGNWGGFHIGTPNIPYLHAGGIVPGIPGSDVPAILQAGERVIPRRAAGMSGGITINIENFTGSDSDIDRLADRLAYRLRMQGAF